MPILKSGRTHLHDAVPIRLGQEFSGYAETINAVYKQIDEKLGALYAIGLGGNAIGTKINLHPEYTTKVIQEVCNRTNQPFREPVNIFSFMQNTNEPIRYAVKLSAMKQQLLLLYADTKGTCDSLN